MGLRLKNRWQSIPNGFQYRQAETGWTLTTWDFALLCLEVQKHRRANPSYRLTLDMTAIENEVETVNASRVSRIPGADIYLAQGDLPPPKLAPPRSLLKRVARVAVGGGVNLEWLASGAEAVPKDQSEKRASICVVCPKHGKGDITAYFTVPVVNAIIAAENLRREWKLETSFDDRLNVCEACQCPLRLKIHMPIQTVVKKLPAEDRAELDPGCWILEESK